VLYDWSQDWSISGCSGKGNRPWQTSRTKFRWVHWQLSRAVEREENTQLEFFH
jgi:hypothetical protein